MFGDSIWAILVVLGPIVLVGAIVFAMMRNKTSARQDVRTEQATRDNYRDENEEDRTHSR